MATTVAPELTIVSFLRGGITLGSTVYLEGTYGPLPARMAEWDEDKQMRKLGAVYFTKGIRPGFPPAAQSYLAPTFSEMATPIAGNAAPPPMEVVIPVHVNLESSEFEATIGLDEEELRAHLAELPSQKIEEFVRWERARPEPRQGILDELGT